MFDDAERAIYPYRAPDGEARYADPLAVRRALYVHTGGRLNALLDEARALAADVAALAGDPEAQGAAEAQYAERADRLAGATRAAFGLPPFDPATGAGATAAYLQALLDDYLGWLSGKD